MKHTLNTIVLILLLTPFFLYAGTLEVIVKGIENKQGSIHIGLYHKKKGFLNPSKQYKGIKRLLKNASTSYRFKDLSSGVYAVAIFHDSNNNNILDKNFLGIPKEGYGVSNNPKTFGKPTFEACKFKLETNKKIIIELNY